MTTALPLQRSWVQGAAWVDAAFFNRPRESDDRAPGGCMPRALVSVVEDDQYFRDSMRRLMRSLGYRVEAFSSAADFLAAARHVETSCLICDVQMPGMSGIDLHRSLTDAGYAIPTILVTGYP